MAITYRTTGAWGAGKGANLTNVEVDTNFWELALRLVELETNPPDANSISNITMIGSQMTVWMQDGSTHGPFTMPVSVLRFRGDWAPETEYFELDMVMTGTGLYLVKHGHVSAETFSPNASNTTGTLYHHLMPFNNTFIGFPDTPSNYFEAEGKYLAVSPAGDAVVFVDLPRPYDIGGHFVGEPASGQLLFRFIAPRDIVFPEHLVNSQGRCGTIATDTTPFEIRRNGSAVGTMTFTSIGVDASFDVEDGFVLFQGDRLDIVAPTSPDATIADITWTLAGTRAV